MACRPIAAWLRQIHNDVVYSAPVPPAPRMLGKPQFEALSEFRFRLTQFLHFSASAARAEAVPPAHYLLLLHLHGFNGRSWGPVGQLAERLPATTQPTVPLVQQIGRAAGGEREVQYG